MYKLVKFLIILTILTFCGKPDDVIPKSEVRDIEIAYEVIVESTSGELSNVYEISGDDINQYEFLDIPDEKIILKSLKYNEIAFFNLKVDNLQINKICYSPTVEVINNKNNDIILIQYNHDHNTVGIFGDSIKDIAISLSEQLIDRDSYWLKNDKLYSENC
tara:strand:- start:126 stop:608 length:483 start_codon:yes stop_codon:yes gene_type:complete